MNYPIDQSIVYTRQVTCDPKPIIKTLEREKKIQISFNTSCMLSSSVCFLFSPIFYFNAGILTYGVFHLPLFFLVNKTFGLPGARAFAGFWRSGLTLGCSGSLLLLPLLLLLVLTLALTLTRL